MRQRQASFFVEYNLKEKSTLLGLMKLRVTDSGVQLGSCFDARASADYIPVHILTVMNEFLRASRENEELVTQEGLKTVTDETQSGADKDVQFTLQTKRIPFNELQLTLSEQRRLGSRNGADINRQSVIVCASLVTKATNLGGLARTCEIFAAEKLILPSLAVTSTDAFTGIAVAAGSWLPMEEVSPDNVLAYLRSCRRRGYIVLGLEQTDSSVSLADYNPPSKCVLLLGKEREGIPVELLQEVDVCIEIPQFGVTRSLNVHVSASLALWEITKNNVDFRSQVARSKQSFLAER